MTFDLPGFVNSAGVVEQHGDETMTRQLPQQISRAGMYRWDSR